MASLSKIAINLLQFKDVSTPQTIVPLYIGDETRFNGTVTSKGLTLSQSTYSSTITLPNGNLLCYHLSNDNKTLILYNTENPINGKTFVIHLPNEIMEGHNTIAFLVTDTTVLINIILKDGLFLTIKLPLDYILDVTNSVTLGFEWFKVQNPYDFTVRVPHLLYPVSQDLLMVFLQDGGLLGLKKVSDDFDLEPLLFNDNSYLQNLTKLFYRRNEKVAGKAISCTVFQKTFLIVLTENYFLKIWDLNTFNLIKEYNLANNLTLNENGIGEVQSYNDSGNFLSLLQNYLVIYLPVKNGTFQIGSLRSDQSGELEFELKNTITSNLASSSIWFLADMKLIKPIDLNFDSSYLNLAVLWKSGSLSKFQILNILYDDLNDYQWIDSTNKTIGDINADFNLICPGRRDNETDLELYERCLFNLKSRYLPEIYEKAQAILSENNIVMSVSNDFIEYKEFLANLETILRDLKGKADEVLTLNILDDGLILVNTVTPFNHSAFKVNIGLENYYFNIHNNEYSDELSRFFKTLDGFTETLSREVVISLAERFLDISTGKIPFTLSSNEKFVEIFKTTLQNEFEVSNLQALMTQLNKFDIVSLLNDFIQDYTKKQDVNNSFIESISPDLFSKVATVESMYQMISIHNRFLVQILMTFVLLDSDYSAFGEQLDALLDINYKQLLFLRLYEQDKLLLIDAIFAKSTKYHQGAKFFSYSEWNDFILHNISTLYSEPISTNTFFIASLKKYIVPENLKWPQQETKIYLRNIANLFYLRKNKCYEFLQAMLLFVAGEYEDSYKYFRLYDGYKDMSIDDLPYFLQDMIDSQSKEEMWTPLIKTFVAKDNRQARFYYYLSCLFSKNGNGPEYALRAIKRSIEISITKETDLDIVTQQHEQLLSLLIQFGMFDEVVDVLRLSHSFLTSSERRNYFSSLLLYPSQNEKFFSTLINSCNENSPTVKSESYLDFEDYKMIDSILTQNLKSGDWEAYKKLYTFRYINKFEREAAEVVLSYWFKSNDILDVKMKKKYCLMIMNILSTFEHSYDQWILNGTDVITLGELKEEYIKLLK